MSDIPTVQDTEQATGQVTSEPVIERVDLGEAVGIEHGAHRSAHWATVRRQFLGDHPDCIYCTPEDKGKFTVEVHHIHAFHCCIGVGRPDLELDERNLVGLCETTHGKPAKDHHVAQGHLGDYQYNNDKVLSEIDQYLGMTKEEIEATETWKTASANRGKKFSDWTHDEKVAFRAMLDETLPPDPRVLQLYFPGGLAKSAFDPS